MLRSAEAGGTPFGDQPNRFPIVLSPKMPSYALEVIIVHVDEVSPIGRDETFLPGGILFWSPRSIYTSEYCRRC